MQKSFVMKQTDFKEEIRNVKMQEKRMTNCRFHKLCTYICIKGIQL